MRLGGDEKEEKGMVADVSIPAWCDWEVSGKSVNADRVMVSIPAWCDWEAIVEDGEMVELDSFNSSLVRLGAPGQQVTTT